LRVRAFEPAEKRVVEESLCQGTTLQAAEKLRKDSEGAKIGGYKMITRVPQIVPEPFWSDLFLPLSEELSFSAACLVVPMTRRAL
jgi:hypothetical protein